jgi:hypothetical protein
MERMLQSSDGISGFVLLYAVQEFWTTVATVAIRPPEGVEAVDHNVTAVK